MTKVLHIISSPRGVESLTIKLGNAIIEKIKASYPSFIYDLTHTIDNTQRPVLRYGMPNVEGKCLTQPI